MADANTLSKEQRKPNVNVDPLKDQREARKATYTPQDDELKVYNQFKERKGELLRSRANVMGVNIDDSMRAWDRKYFDREADIPASELDPEQKPVAMINAFGKVQAALSILIDRNPEIVLHEANPKYSAHRELMKGLATASWQNTNSLGQFKLSIFNAAKRGWFVGRTYNRRLVHEAKFLESVDDKGKKTWATKTITKMNDIAYENINNFNAWIDEQAVPDDFYSARDWMPDANANTSPYGLLSTPSADPDVQGLVNGSETIDTLHQKYDGYPDNTGAMIISQKVNQAQAQGYNPYKAGLKASADKANATSLGGGGLGAVSTAATNVFGGFLNGAFGANPLGNSPTRSLTPSTVTMTGPGGTYSVPTSQVATMKQHGYTAIQ